MHKLYELLDLLQFYHTVNESISALIENLSTDSSHYNQHNDLIVHSTGEIPRHNSKHFLFQSIFHRCSPARFSVRGYCQWSVLGGRPTEHLQFSAGCLPGEGWYTFASGGNPFRRDFRTGDLLGCNGDRLRQERAHGWKRALSNYG